MKFKEKIIAILLILVPLISSAQINGTYLSRSTDEHSELQLEIKGNLAIVSGFFSILSEPVFYKSYGVIERKNNEMEIKFSRLDCQHVHCSFNFFIPYSSFLGTFGHDYLHFVGIKSSYDSRADTIIFRKTN